MKKLNVIIQLAILLILTACQNDEMSKDSYNSNLEIAQYADGNITLKELENYILTLPANQRWNTSEQKRWLKEIIHNLIVEKKLSSEALFIGADKEPKLLNKLHNLERNAYVQQYLSTFSDEKTLTEEDYLRFYSENINLYELPEKRYVYHIYKGLENNPKAFDQMKSLRERIVNGENFKLLAEQHSDSETKNNKGFLGIHERGFKSEDFDSVVFSLMPNSVSEIVKTATGYHLFYVTEILSRKKYQYSEVQNQIKKELHEKHSIDNLKEKALQLPQPHPFKIYDFNELSEINRQNNPLEIVLEVGSYQLTFAQFMYELNEMVTYSKLTPSKELYQKYLQSIFYSETIYQHMISNNIELTYHDLFDTSKKKLIVSEFTKIKMLSYLNKNNTLVKDYFEGNKMRFASPLSVNLQRLTIKKSEQNLMSSLEASVELLDNQKISFEQLAKKHNKEIQNLGWKNTTQLKSLDPQILKYAFLLNIGEYSPVFSNKNFYSILKLIDKKDPVEQSLSTVRKKVVDDYIAKNSAFIYQEIKKELLIDVKINDSVINAFLTNKKSNF